MEVQQMWPHYDCGGGNEFQKCTSKYLIVSIFSPFAPQVNETENKLAMEMSKVDNRSLSEFEIFHEKLETILHPQHYLMIMLKRHLVQLYSGVLAQLDDEDLERVALQKFSFTDLTKNHFIQKPSPYQVKKYAEDVARVYDIIDPGYQKERGTILGSLCEVTI